MSNFTKKQKSFLLKTQKKISKTIYKQNLINNNDNVVIGVSGGKDSFVLLDALLSRKKALNIRYKLAAVHINVKNVPYKADLGFIKNYCKKNNVDFQIIDISVDLNKHISPCFVCSWHKRTALFKFVNQNGFNKLAFGHHLDDSIETLLLNMSFNGEISAIPYKVEMFNGKFEIIRPMLDLEEKFLIEYANLKDLNAEIQICPYADKSKRKLVKNFIAEIQTINKDVRKNIYRSMNKIVSKYLPNL